MTKMKTRKAVVARFKVSGTGKLVRHRPGRRHKLAKKSSARKRALGRPCVIDAGQQRTYARLMGVS